MTALALRTAQYVNGVSALHGEVTRTMWRPMWPDTPADQIPVRSITNGVHVPTWMAGPVFAMLDHHFGPGWLDRVDDPALWERLNDIPDGEIWQMRQALRTDLFSFVRERLRARFAVELDDLVGYGMLGLLDAARKFDHSRGVMFKTYAEHRIRGAILDGLRGMD